MAGARTAVWTTTTTLMGCAAAAAASLVGDRLACFTRVHGVSMRPTFEPDLGEVALVDRRHRMDLCRGDVVLFRYPADEKKLLINRLVALPGDRIRLPETEEIRQIPEGHCWVEGDNSARSWDSRNYGAVPLDLMQGRVTHTVWPPHRFGSMHRKISASQEARLLSTQGQKLCLTRKSCATINLRIST